MNKSFLALLLALCSLTAISQPDRWLGQTRTWIISDLSYCQISQESDDKTLLLIHGDDFYIFSFDSILPYLCNGCQYEIPIADRETFIQGLTNSGYSAVKYFPNAYQNKKKYMVAISNSERRANKLEISLTK